MGVRVRVPSAVQFFFVFLYKTHNMSDTSKVIIFDLDIHQSASKNEFERYDASLTTISHFLFQKSIGSWTGRESCIGTPEDGYIRTNYWTVLEEHNIDAKKEIERIISNFNLGKFTRLKVSDTIDLKEDFKSELESEKELKWSWIKN